jgi:hypothetical protein
MDKLNLSSILGSSAYFTINKFLAKEIGLYATIVLSDLISKEKYFIDNNKLDTEGYFFNTHDNIERDTTLSKHKQIKAFKILQEKGFIIIKRKGIPAKNHFKINNSNILAFFDINDKPLKNLTTGNKEIKQQDDKEFNGNKNNNELKLISIYKEIFDHWNSKKMTVHKKLSDEMKTKIKSGLKKYNKDVIIKAIDNYHTIMDNQDQYWWSHQWIFKDFIGRGLDRFVDEAKPLNVYKNNQGGNNGTSGKINGQNQLPGESEKKDQEVASKYSKNHAKEKTESVGLNA